RGTALRSVARGARLDGRARRVRARAGDGRDVRRFVALLGLLCACRGRASTIAPDPAPTQANPAPSPSPPPPAPIAESFRVRVHRDNPHSFSIEVSNAAEATIDVAHALDVEELGDGGWTSVLYSGVALDLDCTKTKCTTI